MSNYETQNDMSSNIRLICTYLCTYYEMKHRTYFNNSLSGKIEEVSFGLLFLNETRKYSYVGCSRLKYFPSLVTTWNMFWLMRTYVFPAVCIRCFSEVIFGVTFKTYLVLYHINIRIYSFDYFILRMVLLFFKTYVIFIHRINVTRYVCI